MVDLADQRGGIVEVRRRRGVDDRRVGRRRDRDRHRGRAAGEGHSERRGAGKRADRRSGAGQVAGERRVARAAQEHAESEVQDHVATEAAVAGRRDAAEVAQREVEVERHGGRREGVGPLHMEGERPGRGVVLGVDHRGVEPEPGGQTRGEFLGRRERGTDRDAADPGRQVELIHGRVVEPRERQLPRGVRPRPRQSDSFAEVIDDHGRAERAGLQRGLDVGHQGVDRPRAAACRRGDVDGHGGRAIVESDLKSRHGGEAVVGGHVGRAGRGRGRGLEAAQQLGIERRAQIEQAAERGPRGQRDLDREDRRVAVLVQKSAKLADQREELRGRDVAEVRQVVEVLGREDRRGREHVCFGQCDRGGRRGVGRSVEGPEAGHHGQDDVQAVQAVAGGGRQLDQAGEGRGAGVRLGVEVVERDLLVAARLLDRDDGRGVECRRPVDDARLDEAHRRVEVEVGGPNVAAGRQAVELDVGVGLAGVRRGDGQKRRQAQAHGRVEVQVHPDVELRGRINAEPQVGRAAAQVDRHVRQVAAHREADVEDQRLGGRVEAAAEADRACRQVPRRRRPDQCERLG